MSTYTETITETFHTVSCYTCSVRFGITADLYRRVVKDALGSVYCPACGSQTAWQESEDKKRIRELQTRINQATQEVANAKMDAAIERGAKERVQKEIEGLKKRTNAGVCPCCHRSFKALRRHMATAHGIKNGEPLTHRNDARKATL